VDVRDFLETAVGAWKRAEWGTNDSTLGVRIKRMLAMAELTKKAFNLHHLRWIELLGLLCGNLGIIPDTQVRGLLE